MSIIIKQRVACINIIKAIFSGVENCQMLIKHFPYITYSNKTEFPFENILCLQNKIRYLLIKYD